MYLFTIMDASPLSIGFRSDKHAHLLYAALLRRSVFET